MTETLGALREPASKKRRHEVAGPFVGFVKELIKKGVIGPLLPEALAPLREDYGPPSA